MECNTFVKNIKIQVVHHNFWSWFKNWADFYKNRLSFSVKVWYVALYNRRKLSNII